MPNNEIPWTESDTRTLTQMWGDGATARVIGDALGRKQNSVISKAHRLCLPSRPSPIKRGGTTKKRAPCKCDLERAERRKANEAKRAIAAEKAKRHSASSPRQRKKPLVIMSNGGLRKTVMVSEPPPRPIVNLPTDSLSIERHDARRMCGWPMSSGRPWMFCCQPREGARVYCSAHTDVSVVRRVQATCTE